VNGFWCLAVRRAGAPVPRWQQALTDSWLLGELFVDQERDQAVGRYLLVAHFKSATGQDLLPPLRGAQLLHWSRHRVVLAGLQRDELSRSEIAQTWLLVSDSACPKGEGLPGSSY